MLLTTFYSRPLYFATSRGILVCNQDKGYVEKKLPESFEYSFAARNICDDKTRFFPNLGKIYLARELKLVAIDTNVINYCFIFY